MAGRGELPRAALLPCVACQLTGAMLGEWLAHAMFDMSILQFSVKVRGCAGQWLAKAVATAGLLLVILRAPPGKTAARVDRYSERRESAEALTKRVDRRAIRKKRLTRG